MQIGLVVPLSDVYQLAVQSHNFIGSCHLIIHPTLPTPVSFTYSFPPVRSLYELPGPATITPSGEPKPLSSVQSLTPKATRIVRMFAQKRVTVPLSIAAWVIGRRVVYTATSSTVQLMRVAPLT